MIPSAFLIVCEKSLTGKFYSDERPTLVPMGKKVERGRCATGIIGLDTILGGGIPEGSLVMVTGVPGVGKTSLSLEFAIRGALKGEKVLYITTIERPEKLIASVPEFDFFDHKLLENGTLTFAEVGDLIENSSIYGRAENREDMVRLGDAISERIAKKGIRRLVIDSFSTMFYGFDEDTIARDLLMALSEAMYVRNCTGLLIADADPKTSIESIIADGVIALGNHERRSDLLRTMQVLKMKGTAHSRAKYVIDLTTAGVLVTPLLRGGT
jgi:circadian clock protein KaiC